MLVFLVTLSIIALISVIIWYLHTNHVRRSLALAEDSNPLAPLEQIKAALQQTAEVNVVTALHKPGQKQQSWSDEIKSLRDEGRFMEALSLSKKQYPRIMAFRQTLITLRARLKKDSATSEESLNALYQTAILGDLSKSHPDVAPSTDTLDSRGTTLQNSQQYWKTLGYKHLELLTKTDCRLLVKHWGEPDTHGTIDHFLNNQTQLN